ncbi:serine protease [Pseudomonas protegens]|uniref:S1 family peptidase n=1 Tax=Pseudomonas protegens TaxID=380021 RepID=UPI003207B2AD
MGIKPSKISLYPLNIEMKRNGRSFGAGTGFFYKNSRSEVYLVTNYHVATARDPKAPEMILNGWPDSPDELEWSYYDLSRKRFARGNIEFWKNDNINWLEHPERASGVDIVALKIDPLNDFMPLTQLDLGLVDAGQLEVAADLFVVGYPFGHAAGDFLPIWKKGTIASEPYFKPEGQRRFYIDAFVHPGMSGAPVFKAVDREGLEVDKQTHNAVKQFGSGEISGLDAIRQMSGNMKSATFRFYSFIGIYSGRLTFPNGKDPQLGIVWRSELVDEIVNGNCIGVHPYPPLR